MNDKIKNKEWFVGDGLTLADIVVFNSLIIPFSFVLDPGFRKAMPNISSWWEKMSKLDLVKNTAGLLLPVGSGAGTQTKGGKKGS